MNRLWKSHLLPKLASLAVIGAGFSIKTLYDQYKSVDGKKSFPALSMKLDFLFPKMLASTNRKPELSLTITGSNHLRMFNNMIEAFNVSKHLVPSGIEKTYRKVEGDNIIYALEYYVIDNFGNKKNSQILLEGNTKTGKYKISLKSEKEISSEESKLLNNIYRICPYLKIWSFTGDEIELYPTNFIHRIYQALTKQGFFVMQLHSNFFSIEGSFNKENVRKDVEELTKLLKKKLVLLLLINLVMF